MGSGLRAGASSGRAVTTTPGSGWPSAPSTVITRVAPRAFPAASAPRSAPRPMKARTAQNPRLGRARGLIPALVSSLPAWRDAYDGAGIRARFMGSFRKRLLVLIIGLVIVTQTVTLAAVLASTRGTVEARARTDLVNGGSLALKLIGLRTGQLTSAVSATAADFGFREAVASGEPKTVLDGAQNN